MILIKMCTIKLTVLCVFRHYFAVATNPGEQFYAFTSIVTWILNQCGVDAEKPQEVS